jgi:hypothetical protein
MFAFHTSNLKSPEEVISLSQGQSRRMELSRIPRMALEYKSKGKRDIVCPKTR